MLVKQTLTQNWRIMHQNTNQLSRFKTNHQNKKASEFTLAFGGGRMIYLYICHCGGYAMSLCDEGSIMVGREDIAGFELPAPCS